MKNQPNDMVTIEWLLPLFNQKLSQVADGWQLEAENSNYEQMAQYYHQISGALTMINLSSLASLATKLSLLVGASNPQDLNDNHNDLDSSVNDDSFDNDNLDSHLAAEKYQIEC